MGRKERRYAQKQGNGHSSPPIILDRSASLPTHPPISHSPTVGAGISYKATFSGPLPPPSLLADYGKVHKDLPQILVERANENEKHLRKMDEADERARTRGQWMAYSISIFGLTVCVITAMMGYPVASAIAGLTPLTTMASIFLKPTSRSGGTADSKNRRPTKNASEKA